MAIPGTVTLTGPIAPTSTVDKYPVFDAFYGLDGLRNISGITTALNSVPFERRRQGMVVGLNSITGTTYWSLKPEPWLSATTDWSLLISTSGATSISGVGGGGGGGGGGYTLSLGHSSTNFPINNPGTWICGALTNATARTLFDNKNSRKIKIPKSGKVTKISLVTALSSSNFPSPTEASMVLSIVNQTTATTSIIDNDYDISSITFDDPPTPWSRINLFTLAQPLDVFENDTIYIQMQTPTWTAPAGGVTLTQMYTLYIE
jgi:hypothetical protein